MHYPQAERGQGKSELSTRVIWLIVTREYLDTLSLLVHKVRHIKKQSTIKRYNDIGI